MTSPLSPRRPRARALSAAAFSLPLLAACAGAGVHCATAAPKPRSAAGAGGVSALTPQQEQALAGVRGLQRAIQGASTVSFTAFVSVHGQSVPYIGDVVLQRPDRYRMIARQNGRIVAELASDGRSVTAYSPRTNRVWRGPQPARELLPTAASFTAFESSDLGLPAMASCLLPLEHVLAPSYDISQVPAPDGGSRRYSVALGVAPPDPGTADASAVAADGAGAGGSASVCTQQIDLRSAGGSEGVARIVVVYQPAPPALRRIEVDSGETPSAIAPSSVFTYTEFALDAPRDAAPAALAITVPAGAVAAPPAPAGAPPPLAPGLPSAGASPS